MEKFGWKRSLSLVYVLLTLSVNYISSNMIDQSYVLHQERHILFNPKPTSNGGAAVTRAGTKKYAPIRSAQQPLVSLPPIGVAQSLPHHDVFEPGSLLAKH